MGSYLGTYQAFVQIKERGITKKLKEEQRDDRKIDRSINNNHESREYLLKEDAFYVLCPLVKLIRIYFILID